MNLVLDASVVVEVVVETDGAAATWLRGLLGTDDLYWVPGLTLLEVTSALRRLCADPALDGIWTARVDGTQRRQVYAGEVAPVTWSPDGRWIAFGQDHRPSTA